MHDERATADGGTTGLLSQVSSEMVGCTRINSAAARRVRTEWAGANCLVVTLEGTFTPAERKLAEMGEYQRLRDKRLFFQHASEDDFRGIVTRATRRDVRAFVSGLDASQDVASENLLAGARGVRGRAELRVLPDRTGRASLRA